MYLRFQIIRCNQKTVVDTIELLSRSGFYNRVVAEFKNRPIKSIQIDMVRKFDKYSDLENKLIKFRT